METRPMQTPTKRRVLGIRLTTEEQAALRDKADAEGLTLSDYARRALQAYAALRKAGLHYASR
jgi:hypothetical protein